MRERVRDIRRKRDYDREKTNMKKIVCVREKEKERQKESMCEMIIEKKRWRE